MGPIVVAVIAVIILVLAIGVLLGLGIRGERRTTAFEQTRAVQRVEVAAAAHGDATAAGWSQAAIPRARTSAWSR